LLIELAKHFVSFMTFTALDGDDLQMAAGLSEEILEMQPYRCE
jgi:hypothetical protein